MSGPSISVRDFPISQTPHIEEEDSTIQLLSATEFTVAELTDIYNRARVDYIVPMPMSVARMQEYIDKYDVQLARSAVAVAEGQPLGVAMLGVRPGHVWITRLGVIPVTRRRGAGSSLMKYMIAQARDLNVGYVDLEVIRNNLPAQTLFKKLGFYETRELLIMRRPPGPPDIEVAPYNLQFLGHNSAVDFLRQRRSIPSWIDELPSLLNTGTLSAIQVELQDGSVGWLVYHSTVFQLSYLVFQTEFGDPREVACVLAHALHTRHPAQDTKTENVPADDPHLSGMMDMGYIESFRRIEMHLDFG
ncbi:MAG: GNAT family N-acetyltransferase [Anaerolineae bacterium]|nr:GNAT family N-acetyltransferase [Anaerolineae bacterium]